MPMYDFKCDKCGHVIEIIIPCGSMDDVCTKCPKCEGEMKRQFPNTMNFKLKYDPKVDRVSWGNDGYATSQYWSAVKEARSEGKKVKGANEK